MRRRRGRGGAASADRGGFALLLGLFPLISGPVLADEWQARASLLAPRQEVGVAAVDGLIYVVGGILGNRSATARVDRYDPSMDRWETVKDLPRALHHISVAGLDGRLYSLGGLDDGFQGVAACFEYDPVKDAWEEIAPLPTRRGAAAAAVLDGKILVAGGQSGSTSFTDFAAYTPGPDGGSWETLPPMPTARNHLAAAAAGGFFFAISGRAAGLRAEVERYDPAGREWIGRAPIPTPRGGIAAAAAGNSIFVFGGEGNRSHPSGVFGETERYDVVSNSWASRKAMSVPRHGIGAATIGDTVFIPGGSETEGFGVTDVSTAYLPSSEDLPPFRRGDALPDGELDITDPIRILGHLFLSGIALECEDAADATDDGKLDISDAVRILEHLFLGGPPPPPPGGGESGDPTPDLLGCAS